MMRNRQNKHSPHYKRRNTCNLTEGHCNCPERSTAFVPFLNFRNNKMFQHVQHILALFILLPFSHFFSGFCLLCKDQFFDLVGWLMHANYCQMNLLIKKIILNSANNKFACHAHVTRKGFRCNILMRLQSARLENIMLSSECVVFSWEEGERRWGREYFILSFAISRFPAGCVGIFITLLG